MRKQLLILSLLLIPIILCGCTPTYESITTDIECIDGIEYLKTRTYYDYPVFTVHFSYDKSNNPKVIRSGK